MRQVLIISDQAGREWTDRLTLHLKSLRLLEPIRVRAVEYEEGEPGAEAALVDAALEEAARQAAVCLLLLPAHFLNSYPKGTGVLPRLLDEAAGRGALVLRLALSAASYKESLVQRYLDDIYPSQRLYTLPAEGWSEVLKEVGIHVRNFLHGVPAPPPLTLTSSPERAAEQTRPPDDAAPAEAGKNHTFVCYARGDEGFVLRLASELKGGGATVWLDQWDIPSGADWEREIDRALYDCRHFLIVLSPAAVESEEVRSELRTALEEGKRVVPVLYRACRVPRRLRLLQHIDCTGADSVPGEEAVRLLLDALGR